MFSGCNDVVILLENSGSIVDGNNWQLILALVKSIIGEFDVGQGATRIAVIDFGKSGLYFE